MGGKPNSKKYFKKMFRRSGKQQSPTQANEAILNDLEKNFSDSIQVTQTTSDVVSRSGIDSREVRTKRCRMSPFSFVSQEEPTKYSLLTISAKRCI